VDLDQRVALADAVSLRSVSSDNFVVVDTTRDPRVIGETDFTSGPGTLHPKAIYIVEGTLYQVERFDFEGRKAYVREIACDYYTTAITYTKVTPIDTFAEKPAASHGEVHVVSRVVGFKKIKFYTNENVGSGELDLPEQQMHTTSYWLTVPAGVMAQLPFASDDRRDGVVGLAFALKQVAQLLLMCDGHDIRIRSIPATAMSSPAAARSTLRRSSSTTIIGDLFSAALPDAARAADEHAQADRRVPVRAGAGVRRPDRRHRRHASRCASHRPVARAGTQGVSEDREGVAHRPEGRRFEVAGRSHPRDHGAGHASVRIRVSFPACRTRSTRPTRP
jgi:ATP-dependent helicase YprA (DUF1998 family)